MRQTKFNPHTYIASFGNDSLCNIVDAIIADGRDEVIRCFIERGVFLIQNENRAKKRSAAKMPIAAEKSKKTATPKKVLHLSKKTMDRAKVALHGVLLDWKIRGVSLGLCTKSMLLEEAEKDRNKGDGMYKNVKLYTSLAQKMKPSDKVNEVWTEEEVENLKRSIWPVEDAA